MICFKSAFNSFRLVVLANYKLLSADVANSFGLAGLEINMIGRSAVKTYSSAAEPLLDLLVRNMDLNYFVDRYSLCGRWRWCQEALCCP